MKITQDIRSVTDLKRNTRELIDQVTETKRPVVLTTNGKAEAVLWMLRHTNGTSAH